MFIIEVDSTYKGRLVAQGFLQAPGGVENPVVGPELFLNQPKEKPLNEVEKRRFQAITGTIHVIYTSHPLRYSLRDQPADEGHVQARESSHGGGQACASLLDRVHRLLHHLQEGRLSTCFLFKC